MTRDEQIAEAFTLKLTRVNADTIEFVIESPAGGAAAKWGIKGGQEIIGCALAAWFEHTGPKKPALRVVAND